MISATMHKRLGQLTETNIHSRMVPIKMPATSMPRLLSPNIGGRYSQPNIRNTDIAVMIHFFASFILLLSFFIFSGVMPAVFLLSLCVLPGRAAIPFRLYLFLLGINRRFMISFAADLGRSGPIFAAYAQIGPAIFGTLLPHSKTPLCFGPKESKGGVFHFVFS